MSAMYAVYHGPVGLRRIAAKVHAETRVLKQQLEQLGVRVLNASFFDTLTLDVSGSSGADAVLKEAVAAGINLRRIDAVFAAREQMLEFNVPPLLALESMTVALQVPREG